tara:strand:+ start:285 stop:533 length:249 start_codon:yes stop_codon:yes gene_type:complete
MLVRCLNNNRVDILHKSHVISDALKNMLMNVMQGAVMMAANEEYRVRPAIISQVHRPMMANTGLNTHSILKATATPFPPLNA